MKYEVEPGVIIEIGGKHVEPANIQLLGNDHKAATELIGVCNWHSKRLACRKTVDNFALFR